MFFDNVWLPKLWLMKIPELWERQIPENYPKTSNSFSLKFSNEDKKAVTEMESNLNTEESIIKEDMIPENHLLGGYLGTYDVEGTPGEEALLSPEKIPDFATDVLVMHYTDDETWKKVENVTIKDGYVYGTLDSYSPIAVFFTKRDTVYYESNELYNSPLFVCNGISTSIFTNENGEIVAKDANGKETIITADTIVVGGKIDDGKDVEKTSVFVKGVTLKSIVGGSANKTIQSKVKEINLNIEDSKITQKVSAGSYNCKTDTFNLNMKNSFATYIGGGESFIPKVGDVNKGLVGRNCKSYTLNINMNLENVKSVLLYATCENGLMYSENINVNIIGGHYDYLAACGSNGTSGDIVLTADSTDAGIFQTTNRGTVKSVKALFKNSNIKNMFVFGDSTDKTVTGTVDDVNITISGGNIHLYPGSLGGKIATSDQKDLCLVKIAPSTEYTFEENVKEILQDRIQMINRVIFN